MLSVAINNTAMMERLRFMRTQGPKGRMAAARFLTSGVIAEVRRTAPRDTNRYLRGWLQAAADIGLVVALPPLLKSKHREELAKVLALQVTMINKRLAFLTQRKAEWYPESRRPDRYSRKLDREIERQYERLEKARDQARRFGMDENAIVMMRGTSAALAGYQKELRGDALMATVRDQVYGGSGRIIDGSTATVILLHNKEPYCRAIEKRHQVWAKALNSVKMFGMQQAGAKYIATVTNTGRDIVREDWVGGGR